jgi:hypothetical protein
MRPISRFSSLALIGPILLGLSGCPEQKPEVKGEPATSDNADKSGASEAQKPAEAEKPAPTEAKTEEKKDEGGW